MILHDLIKLVKEKENLKKEGKDLPESENSRLNSYNFLLYDHAYFINRDKFLVIIEKFINKEIDADQFQGEYIKMWRIGRDLGKFLITNLTNLNLLDVMEVDLKCDNFSRVVGELMLIADLYCSEEELLDDPEGIPESILLERANSIYYEIKQLYYSDESQEEDFIE